MIHSLAFAIAAITQVGAPAMDVPATPDLPDCRFDNAAAPVMRKADLPPQAQAELERFFAPAGGIADAGQYFEASDAPVSKAPRIRFIRAYGVGGSWIIWFESGGIGLMYSTLALVPTADDASGETVLRAAGGSIFHGNLCAGSNAFLAGARSGG